jgi:hypothetical protein
LISKTDSQGTQSCSLLTEFLENLNYYPTEFYGVEECWDQKDGGIVPAKKGGMIAFAGWKDGLKSGAWIL